ncbi:MAG: hypothetical protein WCP98_12490, partial [Actinomycetes bacterium]
MFVEGNKLDSYPSVGEVQSALQRLFPSARVEVAHEERSRERRADFEAWVQIGKRRLNVLIEYNRDMGSQARLQEAIELLRGRQLGCSSELWITDAGILIDRRVGGPEPRVRLQGRAGARAT